MMALQLREVLVALCASLVVEGKNAVGESLACWQGTRDIERIPWRDIALESDASVGTGWQHECALDSSDVPPEQFTKVCEEYLLNGMMAAKVSLWLESPRPVILARMLLYHKIAYGENLSRTGNALPWPRPFLADKVIHWTPAAFQLRMHPIFNGSEDCTSRPVHAVDREVAESILTVLPKCVKWMEINVCRCPQVRCALFPTNAPCSEQVQRIVALKLLAPRPENAPADLSKLDALEEIRALVDHVGVIGASFPKHFPKLEILELQTIGDLPKAPLKWLAWLGPTHGETQVADTITAICSYSDLRFLKLRSALNSLPPCLGGLVNLHALDVSENRLGQGLSHAEMALPNELGELQHLVEFSAWGQGLLHIEKSNSDTTGCPTDAGCELEYESALAAVRHQEIRSNVVERYKCPGLSWNASLDKLYPVFSWHNLQKFWVDGNRLFASSDFFTRAAESWPHLRTFDIYDNHIEVNVKVLQTFSGHVNLHQLMVGRNRFFGALTRGSFGIADAIYESTPKFKALKFLHLVANPMITGCISSRSRALVMHSGTNVSSHEGCDTTVATPQFREAEL